MSRRKHTPGRAQIAGQFGDRTFMAVGRECVAKFDHGEASLPHAENAAFAALAWNCHPKLIEALKAVRERCPGIHHTDQETGATFADTIDALLEEATP